MRPIKIYNPHLITYTPLVAAIKFKDLIVCEQGMVTGCLNEVVIQDKNLRIRGLHASLAYLDEKYPYPPYYPVEPEKRAVIRMMLDELLTSGNVEAYEQSMPERFFAGSSPTLLDITLVHLAPNTELWNDYRNRINNHRR